MNFMALLNASRVKAGKKPIMPMGKAKGGSRASVMNHAATKAAAMQIAMDAAKKALGQPAKPEVKPMTPFEKTVARVKAEHAKTQSGQAKCVNLNPAKHTAEAGIKPI